MTRADFLALVGKEGISPRAYRLDRDETEIYVLLERDGGWIVYYSESGEEGSRRRFADEPDALDHLFDLLRHDRTTRVRT